MNKKALFVVLSVVIVLSLGLASCKPATPAAPPAPYTEKPYEAMSLAAPDCEYGGLIKEIKTVDELTIEFNLCAPDPAFPSKAAFSAFSIQPREYIEYAMANGQILEKPVGTGPYYVEKWNRGDSIVFKKNESYWGEPGKVPTIVFKWTAESAARLLELQSGTVDGMDNPAPEDFATIEGDAKLALKQREVLNIFYIGVTNTFPPFDNVKVRQAVAMGIDRQRIVDNFYPKGSEVASHFTPCAIPNGCSGEEWYEFDPEAGRALLAEAGFPDGFKTNLYLRDVVRAYLPQVTLVATDIQDQLKQNLNIDAEITVMESGAFIDESSQGRLNGFHLLGWNADYPHITNFLDYHFGKSQAQFGTSYPEIYENLVKGASIADPAESVSNLAVYTLYP